MDKQDKTAFGRMPDGTQVDLLTLRDGPFTCGIITYGGAVRSLTVPDRNGNPVDVALGFDTLADYLAQDKFIGALVGRYANRIAGARFTLGGRVFPLAANDGANHLHGGWRGFDKRVWTVESLTRERAELSLFSPDGEEGYPGGLWVRAAYTLREGGLEVEYRAHSDGDTVCNLTNHTYFNLSGHGSGPVDGQRVQILAGRYTPTGEGSIPTGALEAVEGTPMDLRQPRTIGEGLESGFAQLRLAGGYDHNWAVDGWDGTLRPAARAFSPDTGIGMEVLTTMPGVQFYTGNYLDGCPAGKGGAPYGRRWGFCLETQFFPDSPNQPDFPSPALRPGEVFTGKTVYRFTV